MKKQRVITIITIILLVLIICLASFLGIYVKNEYRVVNKVPKYSLGMEFTKKRVVNLQVTKPEGTDEQEEAEETENTEETENAEEADKNNQDNNLNETNYKKSVKIIKNRLKKLKAEQYKISLDKSNGNIKLILPENDDTDEIVNNLLKEGTFDLKDSETEEVLLDTNQVKSAKVVYNQTEAGTGVYMQIKLDKEGTKKLEEISKIYIQTSTQEVNENEESQDTENIKKVDIYLDGEKITQTYFGQTITDGTLNINVGNGTDNESIKQYVTEAQERMTILNSGVLPLTYTETDNSIEEANMMNTQIKIAAYIILAILVIMVAVLIVKFKVNGIYASILFIGHIGLLLFVIRYISDIKITYEGICGIIVGIIINYIYTYIAFKNIDLSFLKDTTLKLTIKLIPVFIISIILCFISPLININGIGKVLVWSFITMYLYNLTLTQIMIKALNK